MSSVEAPYKIRGENPEDWLYEANRIFGLLSDRLDAIEGYRGHPKFYNYIEASSDVVVTDATKGVILRDDGNPANYWRITVDSDGNVVRTNIGRVYP